MYRPNSIIGTIYSPLLNLYRGNCITIYRGITYIARLHNYFILNSSSQKVDLRRCPWSHLPTVWLREGWKGCNDYYMHTCLVSTALRECEWAMFQPDWRDQEKKPALLVKFHYVKNRVHARTAL